MNTATKISSFEGEYRFLSNFWLAPIVVEGIEYRSVEHAFQASKTLDLLEREWIREAELPGTAKRRGREVHLRKGWNEMRDVVMLQLLRRKFFTHKPLGKLLLETGDAELVEGNYWGDVYWGQVDGRGENRLGKLLMQVREELRKGTKNL